MRDIRVDEDVWSALQDLAEPFVDREPNDVLRRVLNLTGKTDSPDRDNLHDHDAHRTPLRGRQASDVAAHTPRSYGPGGRLHDPKGRRRPKQGETVPQAQYEKPLLRVLQEAGGSASTEDAVERVRALMEDQFQTLDRVELRAGLPRWKSRIHFARNDLAKQGLLDRASPRGVWTLTEAGMSLSLSKADEPFEPSADEPSDE